MGEMADLSMECHWEHEDYGDWFESPNYRDRPRARKTCRCCGTKNLHWGKIGEKWWLFDDNNAEHRCVTHPLSP